MNQPERALAVVKTIGARNSDRSKI